MGLWTDWRFLAVEGPLRVGKSTLAHMLAAVFGARHVAEPENNPFLDRFYRAQPGTAFAAQMWFLRARQEQMRSVLTSEDRVIADYVFEKDKLFAYVNLGDAELELYNRYYQEARAEAPSPQLVIYLQATPEVLKQRLKRKGLPGERDISDAYIEQIAAAYEHFFFHYTASNLLVVDTTEIDFVRNPEDFALLRKRLEEPVQGTEYFHPVSCYAQGG
ncbi:deoxynucleoside kinase [Silvibacterium dinghuense]|uniref:Deoxynucleoside kinase n=2 Tax=Silvibacterium dinghuense TaxID=1560006 RepID=A0A4Q1SKK6_9BACT|nr:deoxynucleoside kinase [Silvibacterium dinghuense]